MDVDGGPQIRGHTRSYRHEKRLPPSIEPFTPIGHPESLLAPSRMGAQVSEALACSARSQGALRLGFSGHGGHTGEQDIQGRCSSKVIRDEVLKGR